MDEPSASSIALLDGSLLRAFTAFAEERNFTRAARRVGLSQPALFERVQRLTAAIDRPLYERVDGVITLTVAGVRVAAFARDELSRASAFEGELKGGARDTVVLAAGEGSYLYLLAPALRRFARLAPKTTLAPLTLGGPAALEAVDAGAAHLAVGVYDLVPRRMVAESLVKTPLCAAFSRQHALAKKQDLTLKDLAGQRLIVAPTGQRHRDFVGRALASVGGALADHVEADGWPLMLAFAAAAVGVAIVNGICRPPEGVVLRPIRELGHVTYRVVRRRDSFLSEGAEQLIATLREIGAERRFRRSG